MGEGRWRDGGGECRKMRRYKMIWGRGVAEGVYRVCVHRRE